jgi:uncharacterized protein YkwD
VGIADRDYMHAPRRPEHSRRARRSITSTGVVLGLAALALFAIHFRDHLPWKARPFVVSVKPLWFGPSFRAGQPYPPNDAWAGFLPRPSSCAGSTSEPTTAPAAEQAMLCVLNYARVKQGLRALPLSPQLRAASRLKALDIIRCQNFSHEACGKDARAVADAAGYPQFTWGENIYAGSGPFVPARVAADGWLNSPHHRENLFRPQWTEQGVAVVVAPTFRGQKNVAIWVSEFGERR